MDRITFRIVMLSTLMLSTVLLASPASPQDASQQPAPDNTRMNKGDGNSGAKTADSQMGDPADRDITKRIRSSIYQDNSLSTYAHNIKIISRNGAVTLKGPVRSDDEKANIEAKATAVAGEGNVHSMLTIVPPKS